MKRKQQQKKRIKKNKKKFGSLKNVFTFTKETKKRKYRSLI